MDQDLTLMEQLLTLNEKIEDIKVKRLYGSSRESFHSSCDFNSGSDWSLPDSNVYCRHSKGYLGKATVHRSSAESVDDTGPDQVYRQTVSDEKDFWKLPKNVAKCGASLCAILPKKTSVEIYLVTRCCYYIYTCIFLHCSLPILYIVYLLQYYSVCFRITWVILSWQCYTLVWLGNLFLFVRLTSKKE